MKIRTATGITAIYMRAFKFDGWTSFWRVVYVLPGHERDERLLRHERCHLEQIQQDGRLVFAVKYLRWLAKHGYWTTPTRSKPAPPSLSHPGCPPLDQEP